uniref:Ig-like domain-containing protein n=1 Tax=Catharus ustulatus TaxID=91951 RepID=A0A8C3UDL2_CATUS
MGQGDRACGDRDVGFGTLGLGMLWGQGDRDGAEGQGEQKDMAMGMWPCGAGGGDLCQLGDSPTPPRVPLSPRYWLVLQVPARALLEGDTVTLRCRKLGTLQDGTELFLSPLQRNHSGHYHCRGLVTYWSSGWEQSAPVSVTVQGEHPTLPEGSPLNLSCLSIPSPLRPPAPLLYRFYRDGQLVGGPQGSLQLLLPAVGVSHSGNYSCEVKSEGGAVRKSSARLEIFLVSPRLSPVSPHRSLCPLTPPWGDPIPHISPSNPSLPCPPPPTAGASPSPRPQPCLCPRSARGQCHHHPRSPGTPGDTTAGGDTTGNHWTPLEHRWGHSGSLGWQEPCSDR